MYYLVTTRELNFICL